jgi:hypothetical protein
MSLRTLGRKLASDMIKKFPEATATAVFTLLNSVEYDPTSGTSTTDTTTKTVACFMGTATESDQKMVDGQQVETFKLSFPADKLPRLPGVQDECRINGVRYTIEKSKVDPVVVMAVVLVCRA